MSKEKILKVTNWVMNITSVWLGNRKGDNMGRGGEEGRYC